MHKYSKKAKIKQPRSIFDTARRAMVHLAVFSVISITGHIATTTLMASVGTVGMSIIPPIGGMFMM